MFIYFRPFRSNVGLRIIVTILSKTLLLDIHYPHRHLGGDDCTTVNKTKLSAKQENFNTGK